jgi:rfaE bifunctional protein kinase chain/domain
MPAFQISNGTGMTASRFREIAAAYPRLRVAVIGDVCLDRYLEIDARRAEVSIETHLNVHNVTRVRSQPGGAGTIINNLSALGIGAIFPVGFCGEDGEGWELQRALRAVPGVCTDDFHTVAERRTFTYTKPLLMPRRERARRAVPRELNRLDFKNWTRTPRAVEDRLIRSIRSVALTADALVLLDQVDLPNTGVLTRRVLDVVGELAGKRRRLLILGDSRRGFRHFPAVALKMNLTELARALRTGRRDGLLQISRQAGARARRRGRHVFVTLAERGIIGAAPDGTTAHAPALPLRGEIDIVGAGDAVTANLVCALLGGASLPESLEIANAAASVVIHQLGTTGTATGGQIARLLEGSSRGQR